MKLFARDAQNLLGAQCVVFVGTREQAQGLNCGHCGFATCGERPDGVPCAINSVDVGIALGAACSKACDYRVDTRVMFGRPGSPAPGPAARLQAGLRHSREHSFEELRFFASANRRGPLGRRLG